MRGRIKQGLPPSLLLFSPAATLPLSTAPYWAGGALPMAELLSQLPWPPLAEGSTEDASVPRAKWQSQQPKGGGAEGLAHEPWRFLEVPSIYITPCSDGESPPCTPTPQRLQLPRTPDPDSLSQDRSAGCWDKKEVLSPSLTLLQGGPTLSGCRS